MGSTKSTTTSVQSIPAYMEQGGQQLFQQAQNLTSDPNDFVYTGPRYAGLNPTQTGAFDQITAMNDNGADRIDAGTGARSVYDEATGRNILTFDPFSAETAQRYINPHDELVTQRAARDLMEQRALGGQAIQDNARAAGAFGGARHAMQESLYDNNTADALAGLYAEGRQKGFDTALGQYNQDRQDAFAQGAFNDQALGRDLALTNAQLSAGNQQQQDAQNQLLADQDAWREQANAGLDALTFQQGILNGTPYSRTTTSTQPGTSPWSQALGGALGIGGLLLSDPEMKEGKQPVDGESVLDALRGTPVSGFEYTDEAQGAFGAPDGPRMGPMADDWQGAFGGDGHTIDRDNMTGALIAAVQALDERTRKMAA